MGSGWFAARSADREEGSIPQRAQDDPRSECRSPKGNRKPERHGRLLRRIVSDNWPDTSGMLGLKER